MVRITTSTVSMEARVEKSLNLIATLYFDNSVSTNRQATHRTVVAASASSYFQAPAVIPVSISMSLHEKGRRGQRSEQTRTQGAAKRVLDLMTLLARTISRDLRLRSSDM